MELDISKEWFERHAALEDGCEIGAGFEIVDADVREYLGEETYQDIVDDVSRRFAADLDCIFGKPSAPGGFRANQGEDA